MTEQATEAPAAPIEAPAPEPTPTPEPTEPPTQAVPYDRFASVVEAKQRAEAEVAAFKEAAAVLEAEREEARQALQQLQADHDWRGHEVTLAREGVHDSDVVEFIRYQYGRAEVPEGAERPAFGEWLTDFRANKPHLFQSGSTSQQVKPPSTNKGAKAPPPTSAYSAKQIASMTREEYLQHRDELKKQVLNR